MFGEGMEADYLDNKYIAIRKLKTHASVLEAYSEKLRVISSVRTDAVKKIMVVPPTYALLGEEFINVSDYVLSDGNWPCRVVYPEQLITIRDMSLPLYFVRVAIDSHKVEISGGSYLKPVCFYELESYSSYITRVVSDISEIFRAEEEYHINKKVQNYRIKLVSQKTGMGMDFNIFASDYFAIANSGVSVDYVKYSSLFYDQTCAEEYATALNKKHNLSGVIYHEL